MQSLNLKGGINTSCVHTCRLHVYVLQHTHVTVRMHTLYKNVHVPSNTNILPYKKSSMPQRRIPTCIVYPLWKKKKNLTLTEQFLAMGNILPVKPNLMHQLS